MTLIDEIRERAHDAARATDAVYRHRSFPPATLEEVASVERELGFPLPAVLRQLYLEVGNGGFGPGYGLIGLAGGAPDVDPDGSDLVSLYGSYSSADQTDPLWNWPMCLLPVVNLGCGMYICIDCSSPEGAAVLFEPSNHVEGQSWADSFISLEASTEEWLRAWATGRDLLEPAWNKKFGLDEGVDPAHLTPSVSKMWVVTVDRHGRELGDGHWVDIPEPDRFAADGFAQIDSYVTKLIKSSAGFTSLIIATPDQQVAVSLWRRSGHPEFHLSVEWRTEARAGARRSSVFRDARACCGSGLSGWQRCRSGRSRAQAHEATVSLVSCARPRALSESVSRFALPPEKMLFRDESAKRLTLLS